MNYLTVPTPYLGQENVTLKNEFMTCTLLSVVEFRTWERPSDRAVGRHLVMSLRPCGTNFTRSPSPETHGAHASQNLTGASKTGPTGRHHPRGRRSRETTSTRATWRSTLQVRSRSQVREPTTDFSTGQRTRTACSRCQHRSSPHMPRIRHNFSTSKATTRLSQSAPHCCHRLCKHDF